MEGKLRDRNEGGREEGREGGKEGRTCFGVNRATWVDMCQGHEQGLVGVGRMGPHNVPGEKDLGADISKEGREGGRRGLVN